MKKIEIRKVSNYKFVEYVMVEESNFFQWLNDLHQQYNEDMILEWYYDQDMNEEHVDLCVKIYDDYNE